MASISVLATDLNVHTFQGMVRDGDGYILPTLDGRLLRVNPDGSTKTLVQFCRGFECERFGVPFGIAASQGNFYLTVSSFGIGGRLIRVSSSASITEIADFTSLTPLGAPFGIIQSQFYSTAALPSPLPLPSSLPAAPSATPAPSSSPAEPAIALQPSPNAAIAADRQPVWIVTLSPNVLASQGLLVRVTAEGAIAPIADLSEYGIPFALIEREGKYIVAQEKGHLVEVSPAGDIKPLVDFQAAKLGIPLGLTLFQNTLVVALNAGPLVQVTSDAEMTVITNLAQAGYAFPFAVLAQEDSLVVATTSGKLVRVVP